jgi:hypothetical protein
VVCHSKRVLKTRNEVKEAFTNNEQGNPGPEFYGPGIMNQQQLHHPGRYGQLIERIRVWKSLKDK